MQIILGTRPELLPDAQGRDPLKYAKEKKLHEIVRLLEQYNGECNIRREDEKRAKSSPFAPCDPEDKEPTTGLLWPIYVELMYMQKHDHGQGRGCFLDNDKNHLDEIVKILKLVDPVCALRELHTFQNTMMQDFNKTKFRCKKLFEGLERWKAELMYPRNDELWVTRGFYGVGQDGKAVFVRPEIMLMTRDESCMMRELRGQVQNGMRPPGEPYLEKIYLMPAPTKGLPPAELLFSEAKFVIPKAVQEAQALIAVKCKLDEKDISVSDFIVDAAITELHKHVCM